MTPGLIALDIIVRLLIVLGSLYGLIYGVSSEAKGWRGARDMTVAVICFFLFWLALLAT